MIKRFGFCRCVRLAGDTYTPEPYEMHTDGYFATRGLMDRFPVAGERNAEMAMFTFAPYQIAILRNGMIELMGDQSAPQIGPCTRD